MKQDYGYKKGRTMKQGLWLQERQNYETRIMVTRKAELWSLGPGVWHEQTPVSSDMCYHASSCLCVGCEHRFLLEWRRFALVHYFPVCPMSQAFVLS
jgi:hypothetical protein